MREAATATVHASAVLTGSRAMLIRGPAGSGKSRLALALIEAAASGRIRFARLVADDRVELTAGHGRLLVRPPPALAGLIEVRGVGVRRLAVRAGRGCRAGRRPCGGRRRANACFFRSNCRDKRHPAATAPRRGRRRCLDGGACNVAFRAHIAAYLSAMQNSPKINIQALANGLRMVKMAVLSCGAPFAPARSTS